MQALCRRECTITTIEKYEPQDPGGKGKFQTGRRRGADHSAGGGCGGDFERIWKARYDFIFMDAAKGQYIHWLPMILRLLSDGGILFSDNVLQDGDVVQSRYAVERRDRTIHARMREYLYTLKHMEELETSIIPHRRWSGNQCENRDRERKSRKMI